MMENRDMYQINLNENGWRTGDNPELIGTLADVMQFLQLYSAGMKTVRTRLEILDDELRVQFGHNPIHHMAYRLKSPGSIINKLRRKGAEANIENARAILTDIAGVRVICNYLDDIYRISDMLSRQDDVTVLYSKDYIKSPKESGYRSLHLVTKVPVYLSERREEVPVEIQIRTIAMDFWASLEHNLKYKSGGEVTDELRKRLRRCAEDVSGLDHRMQAIYKDMEAK